MSGPVLPLISARSTLASQKTGALMQLCTRRWSGVQHEACRNKKEERGGVPVRALRVGKMSEMKH